MRRTLTVLLILVSAITLQAQPWKADGCVTRIQIIDYVSRQSPDFARSISNDAYARIKDREFFVKYGSDRVFNNYRVIAWGYVSGSKLRLIIPNAGGKYRTYKSKRSVRRLPGDTVLRLTRDSYEGDWVLNK